ncbi:threonine-phosphate decarboxylase CobD [Stakelama tenebrarum]|uniref:threonine-phosphate decarboxylase n=1 Tax=Stakelama tenebrarum TaxID=2711215 RepID=A0A6G6Y2D4_9SPHN|nr:threonine-phosphate decarboxylase CobD [Sphingosinithalassobacter tenebrarum]QIG79059.1 threonine-phosphate decarboxylase [Sphingosinithalassobacter tenebrarum]
MSGELTRHGGRLDAARARFGGREQAWIDLSTGINPVPWPDAAACAADWATLPSPAALKALEEQAARYFGVDADHVCALPGSETGLRLLPQILPLPGVHIGPTYRTHSEIFPASRSCEADAALATPPGAILIANPNNPDGRIRSATKMRGLLARLEQQEGWLIVDEAFADTDPAISLATDIGTGRRLIIFRSFGKFFGLAGLRLGFVLAPPRIVRSYRALLGDWPLNAAALSIGTAAYTDGEWIERTRRQLPASAARLDDLLNKHGLTPIGACPLFRLIETGRASALFEGLARHAILTRPFDYAANWLRIGLPGDEAAWRRLDAALADG